MKTIILILQVLILIVIFTNKTTPQCHRKKLCKEDFDIYGDYDYKSQSSFSYLSPNDSSKVTVVLYNNQEYRIFVCNDPELGTVKWKLLQPERVTKRTIKSIKKDTVIIYETNEYGDYIMDNNGNFKIKSKQVRVDTIWNVERVTRYKEIFKSEGAQQPYFEIRPPKTASYIITVEVPSGEDPKYEGCVNVYVGRRELSKKRLTKEWSLGTIKK